jgi:hypothetical protein
MPAELTSASGATSSVAPAPPGGFRRLWRAIKQLFHEVIGAIFAILAFSWFARAFRAWSGGDVARWLVTVALVMAVIFTLYAISSFRRSRKI